MATLITVLILTGLVILIYSSFKKVKSGNWVQFFSKGREAGFTASELEMLRRITNKCNLSDPCLIFRSQSQLDTCIRYIVHNIRMGGESEEYGTQDFLSKLYDYRNKIEMNKPESTSGISSSRQISEGQFLRVLVQGIGVFRSEVVKNGGQYLTISRPLNNKISTPVAWRASTISVYFWREDDAGYVFDSYVVDEVFSKGISALKIEQSDSLFRTQKRKSTRIRFHKAAFLYLADDADSDPGRPEKYPGMKCFLEDLSDSGCAISIGGQAVPGLRIKVQFALDNIPICMLGTVRYVDFREEANRSTMHLEAEPLPLQMRNQILGEVFGMHHEEDDDELPFRIPDVNAESAGANRENNPVKESSAGAADE